MTTDKAIADLEAKRRVLETELKQVTTAIWELKLAACPIKVGDVVRYEKDGREYRVTKISHPEWGWVYAHPKRADGSWGTSKRHLLGRCTPVTEYDGGGAT